MFDLMMSRNFENFNKSTNNNNNNNTSSTHSHAILPPIMHMECDCQGTNNTDFSCCNKATKSAGYLRHNLLLNKYFGGNLHTFAVYENLCENCGFGICDEGRKICDLCGFRVENCTIENIYENICENCGLIYSGDNCTSCIQRNQEKVEKDKQKQLNIFSGIIETFKQKSKFKEKPVKIKRKIEIIHNVDTAFKTNKSFDLNEICRLKNLTKTKTNNIYGKLRNSAEQLVTTNKNPFSRNEIKSSLNDLNVKNTNFQPFPVLQTSTPELYSTLPLYENLDKFIYTTISPFDDVTDNSLIHWMTSLKKHTEDYNEENICNVKCIPSRSFGNCGYCSYVHSLDAISVTVDSSRSDIENFKKTFMENQSKRKAIYFKNEQYFDPLFVVLKNSYDEKCETIENNNIESDFVNGLINLYDSYLNENEKNCYENFLRPKNLHYKSLLEDEPAEPHELEIKTIVVKPRRRRNNKSIKLKKIILCEKLMSISLNKIVITIDRDLLIFLNNIYSKNFDKHKQHLMMKYFNQHCHKNNQLTMKKNKLSDFEKQLNQIAKKEINDFEIKGSITKTGKRLEDFQKLDPSPQLVKMLSDFEMKIKINKSPPTQTINSIELTNVSDFDEEKEGEENIYQPIWTFQTIGHATENYASDDQDCCYDSNNFCEIIDNNEWEVAEEFLYTKEINDEILENIENQKSDAIAYGTKTEPFYDPYQRICVLYNLENLKLNRIFYDVNQIQCDRNVKRRNSVKQISVKKFQKNPKLKEFPIPVSVQAWKYMLMNVNYVDDEEDMIVPESFLFANTLTNRKEQQDPEKSQLKRNISNNDTKYPKDGTQTDAIDSTAAKSKKEIKFRDTRRISQLDKYLLPDNEIGDEKSENIIGLSYKNNLEDEPADISKKIGYLIYEVTLDEVEKDTDNPSIPKFVVECIKFIEMEENIRTNGIYRASGKKESIDKLKKKMDESRKSNKYLAIGQEDVHTITGALKQFFRELKTDLIPIDLVKSLPNELDSKDSLLYISQQLNNIEKDTKETLKYVLRHLIKVDQNNQHNLMTAGNLSIVWGACLFTSSAVETDIFETTELIRRNALIYTLIQNYDTIFEIEKLKT